MFGWIGDARADLKITLYADADFAGDTETTRSTSGVFVALTGPNSFYPISALSKRQSCVSHSTPEAELVAADLAIRTKAYLPWISGLYCWTKRSSKSTSRKTIRRASKS